MKLRIGLPAFTLLAAQIPVGWATLLALACAKRHWIENAHDMELPLGTVFAIRFGMTIPVLTAAAAVFLLIVSWRKGMSLLPVAFAIAIGEIMFLAFFASGLVLPGMTILYRLGNF